MAESDRTVNDIIARYDRSISNQEVDSSKWLKFINEKNALNDLLEELEHLRKLTKPVPKTLGDVSDLPEELLSELSALKTDDLENQMFTIINSCENKEANIDTILVELYRRFQVIQKRTYITNKLWRMTQKDGLIWPAEGKGYYTTAEPPLIDKIERALEADTKYDLDDEDPFGDTKIPF